MTLCLLGLSMCYFWHTATGCSVNTVSLLCSNEHMAGAQGCYKRSRIFTSLGRDIYTLDNAEVWNGRMFVIAGVPVRQFGYTWAAVVCTLGAICLSV